MANLEKKLISSTIIPNSMYVERNADKQLKDIIRDMGRPAYILVARQMGKTNLLLNAIRNVKGANDIFGYIDLSNRFDTDRECFRNIIDKILDSSYENLKSIAESIYLKREGRQIVAHREHQRELREILSGITGKLIINLDEIDSLTVADYSDKIFAQIRSIYFDRINYQEFERLSYIISGVAEPSDIIKDKSISPFNIGQKILLGDFTSEEFMTLVEKANLSEKLEQDVKQRVFYWTNGNPRLSWEILSEVEDKIINGELVDTSTVDDIVNHSYLTNFDKPPIDHIRLLVEKSAELRDSVISIYYEKTESINSNLKNRLYLAGILGSDYEFGDVRIKNRIVEKCLDLNWLIELGKTSAVSITKANKYYEESDFRKAEEIYTNIIDNKDFSEFERVISNFKLGACYFNLGEDLKAIRCYENKLFDKSDNNALYNEQVFILATSYSRLKQNDESQKFFDKLIEEKNDKFYHLALVGKAKLLEVSNKIDNRDEILRLNKSVIDSGIKAPNLALSEAFYNMANLILSVDKEESYNYFIQSSKSASLLHNIKPLIHALRIKTDNYNDLFDSIINTLKSGEIKLEYEIEPYGLEVSSSDLADLITISHTLGKNEEIEIFINAIKDNCLEEKANLCNIMFEMARAKFQGGDTKSTKYFLYKMLSLERQYTIPIPLFAAYKLLSYIDPTNNDILDNYFSRVQNYTDDIDQIDLVIFQNKIIELINNSEINKAEKYCDLIIEIEGLNTIKSQARLLTILFLKMRCIEGVEEKRQQAIELKEIIDNMDEGDLSLTTINGETLSAVTEEIDAAIFTSVPVRQFVRAGVKYGRNDMVKVKYQDGREENRKYKHVAESLNKGFCKVII